MTKTDTLPRLRAAHKAAPATDTLVELYAEYQQAERRDRRANERQDLAHVAARKAGRVIDAAPMTVGARDCMSAQEIIATAKKAGFSPERGRELARIFRERQAAARKERIKAGLGPVDTEAKAARAALDRTLRNIVTTPARSYVGLAVKLRLIKRDIEDGPTSEASALVRSALADALRLAKGGAA